MKQEVLLALVSSLIEDAIAPIRESISHGERGPRGIRGKDGKDFSFDENKEVISSLISNYLDEKQDTLKLKFSDLSDTDKESLKGEGFCPGKHKPYLTEIITNFILDNESKFKLTFDSLTQDQLESLKGPRGFKGKDGKDFDIEESKDFIVGAVSDFILTNRESFQLKFTDLTEEETYSLRGPRGQRGKQGERGLDGEKGERGLDGKDFIFEDHSEVISDQIKDKVEAIKEELKLRFTDLTPDEIFSLRGPRGQRGKQGERGEEGEAGKDFIYDDHQDRITASIRNAVIENKDSLKLTFSDLSAIEKRNLQGLKGRDGKDGKDGRDGLDAPIIEEIKIDEGHEDFSLIFEFSDGTSLETNRIDLPKAKQSFSGGGGGGGSSIGGTSELEIYDSGVVVGKTSKLNFDETLTVVQDGDTITIANPEKKIKIFNEEGLVSDNLKSLTFEGNIEVVNKTTMADWEHLSDVSSLSGYDNGDTGKVVIRVLSTEEAERLAATRICAEIIPIRRLVTLVSKTHVMLAQPDETRSKATVYGISVSSGNIGDTVKVLFFGDDEDVSYTFDINQPIYLGVDGTLQTTPYLGVPGFITRVGYGHGQDTLMVDIDEPVEN